MIAWAPYPRSAARRGREDRSHHGAPSLTNSIVRWEPGGGRSRLRGVPYSGGPPKRRRAPHGRRHGIRKMQAARSPDADEWVSQRVREREGTHEEAPASRAGGESD